METINMGKGSSSFKYFTAVLIFFLRGEDLWCKEGVKDL